MKSITISKDSSLSLEKDIPVIRNEAEIQVSPIKFIFSFKLISSESSCEKSLSKFSSFIVFINSLFFAFIRSRY